MNLRRITLGTICLAMIVTGKMMAQCNPDTIPPTTTCPASISQSTSPGICTASVSYSVNVSDNCATGIIPSLTVGIGSGNPFPFGITNVSYSATDTSGNTSTCSFTVTVFDAEAPGISCPSNITAVTGLNQCSATVNYASPNGTDNCSGATTTQTLGMSSGSSFPVGTTTNVFQVTDAANNTSTCSFSVAVSDAQPPSIICPANIVLPAPSNACAATVTYTAPNGTDNCPGATTTIPTGLGSGASFPVGNNTETYRVTDAAGLTSTCSFLVTVQDITPPIAACQNVTVTLGGLGTGSTTPNAVDNGSSDACTPLSRSLNNSNFTCANLGSGNTVVLTVTDNNGNTATCSANVTVQDLIAPSITCPPNVSAPANTGTCAAIVSFANPTATDNCTGTTVTQLSGVLSGSAMQVGTVSNTFRATDASGNTATCSFNVTVTDLQLPTFSSCPSAITAVTSLGSCFATVTYTTPVGTDNCPAASTTQTTGLPSGASYPVGVTTNTFRVTDASSNTASCLFTVTVTDAQAPSVTCPSNISVNATSGICSTTVNYNPPVRTDNCGIASFTQLAGNSSGATFPVGITTNTFRATDAAGNSSTCSFTVTVVDAQLPTINCPSNQTSNATIGPNCCATRLYANATSSDNCAGVVTTRISGFPSGSCFPVGVNPIVFQATDASGNTTTCQFTITINDAQAPTIACPGSVTLPSDPGYCGKVYCPNATTAVDFCSSVVVTQISGLQCNALFPVGTTHNQYLATDAAGNSSSCGFDVIVQDNELPQITCPPSDTFPSLTGTCNGIIAFTPPIGIDNCSNPVTVLASGVSSGSIAPVGTWVEVYLVTDASGNTSSCSFTITISDEESPIIACPPSQTVPNDQGQCNATISYATPLGTDNCNSVTSITSGLPSGSSFLVGSTIVTFQIIDSSGNSATCSFTVDVQDNESPTIVCPNDTTIYVPQGVNSAISNYIVTAIDNCAVLSTTQLSGLPSGSNFPAGNTTNQYLSQDIYGNDTLCTWDVSVQQNVPVTESYCWESEQGTQGWNAPSQNGWTYGELTSFPGNHVWATNLGGNYSNQANLWVQSPLFDITSLERPMISFKYRNETEAGHDGVVLQASTDNGANWENLSTLRGGKNWFNVDGIIALPGVNNPSARGWTGTSNGWVEAAARLEHFQVSGTSVTFRFVFASDATGNSAGFAFDDFCIREREKVVLAELFVEDGVPGNRAAESYMYQQVGWNGADMAMVAFHDNDPFQTNQFPGRANYYAIPQLPFLRVDGIDFASGIVQNWTQDSVYLQIFDSVLFKFDSLSLNLSGNTANPYAMIRCVNPSGFTGNLRINLALVERQVTNSGIDFEWVMRRMIPTATGSTLSLSWNNGTTQIVTPGSTTITNLSNSAQAGIVAWIQDEITKEVYQAAYAGAAGPPVFSNEGNVIGASEIRIYPNPASGVVNVFSSDEKPHMIRLVDSWGRLVLEQIPTSRSTTMIMENLNSGLYFVQVYLKSGSFTRAISIIRP